jgi:hypothetical protein
MHQHQSLTLGEQPGGILADGGEIHALRPTQLDHNDIIAHKDSSNLFIILT